VIGQAAFGLLDACGDAPVPTRCAGGPVARHQAACRSIWKVRRPVAT
jgi:hypothetical protein